MAADLRRKEKAVTCIQSHFRGHIIRSKFNQVQIDFEKIVRELDGQDYRVLWPSNRLTLPSPSLITNNKAKLDSKTLSEDDHKHAETGQDDCEEEEDKTLTQEVCDKTDGILTQSTSDGNQERLENTSQISGFMNDSVKKNLEQNFNEAFPNGEEQFGDPAKLISQDEIKKTESGEHDQSSRHQERHEIMTTNSGDISPVDTEQQVFTQHSTPLSSDTKLRKKENMSRHPLLTDSWMTDKSFDAASYEVPISNKDLHQKREQISMELLWTQQAIESRINYLRLKKDITATNVSSEDS